MKHVLILSAFLVATPAFAQQQPVSDTALQVDIAVSNMALEFNQMRKQLAEAQAKIKELETKEAQCPTK